LVDWKLAATLAVTVLVALGGWWAVHLFAAWRDLINERRKLRITYLLEAYRRLEDAVHRDDPERSWPKWESAIADIQLLGSQAQATMAREFALTMARDGMAPLDDVINDLRRSLRKELHLPPINGSVVHLRFHGGGPRAFDKTLETTAHDIEEAKAEGAAVAPPDVRLLLEQGAQLAQPTGAIVLAWNGLEMLVRLRLDSLGVNTATLGSAPLLDLALQRGVITDVQHKSLRGLNVMRNLAVHAKQEVDADRAEEFLALAEAMRVVLEITEPGRG
jgi:hypothetical protein